MGQNATPSGIQIVLVLAALAGAIFAVDISIPLGVAGGVPYIAVVLIAAWAPRPVRIILATAASATLLTIGAYFWSPAGGVPWMVLSNRVLEMAEVVKPFRPMFFEEPLRPENRFAMGELRKKIGIPIATGEMLYTKYEFRDIIAAGAADILQPDLLLCGGSSSMIQSFK